MLEAMGHEKKTPVFDIPVLDSKIIRYSMLYSGVMDCVNRYSSRDAKPFLYYTGFGYVRFRFWSYILFQISCSLIGSSWYQFEIKSSILVSVCGY